MFGLGRFFYCSLLLFFCFFLFSCLISCFVEKESNFLLALQPVSWRLSSTPHRTTRRRTEGSASWNTSHIKPPASPRGWLSVEISSFWWKVTNLCPGGWGRGGSRCGAVISSWTGRTPRRSRTRTPWPRWRSSTAATSPSPSPRRVSGSCLRGWYMADLSVSLQSCLALEVKVNYLSRDILCVNRNKTCLVLWNLATCSQL